MDLSILQGPATLPAFAGLDLPSLFYLIGLGGGGPDHGPHLSSVGANRAQGAKKRKLAPALSSQAIPPNLLFGGSGGSNFQVPKLLGK